MELFCQQFLNFHWLADNFMPWRFLVDQDQKWINYDCSHSKKARTLETQATAPGCLVHLFFWVNPSFKVDLQRLSECSEYFRALSQSRMRETSECLIQLDHVPSSIFYHFLEYSFHNRFIVPVTELDAHIQVWLCVSLSGAHCQSLTVYLLLWPRRSAAISWLRPSSPSAWQFWRMNSSQTTAGPTWVWLRRSAVSS